MNGDRGDDLEAKLKPEYYFDLEGFEHKELFDDIEFVWEALDKLPDYMKKILPRKLAEYDFRKDPEAVTSEFPVTADSDHAKIHTSAIIGPDVYIGKGTIVGPFSTIEGPTVIGENCVIRPKAQIRGNVLTGNYTRVGNTEVKHSILIGGTGPKRGQRSSFIHRNYIGHSILGKYVSFGAAVTTAALRADRKPVKVELNDKIYNTNLPQFGAVIGDSTLIGCGTTFNPGSFIGKNSVMYNIHHWQNFAPSDSIIRPKNNVEQGYKITKRL